MKKFLFAIVAVLAVLATSGCDSTTPWGVEYSLKSNGESDASVTFVFINGGCTLNGDADYLFTWGNVVPQTLRTEKPLVLDEALRCNDAQTLQAAEYVNDWLEEWFKVVSFEGNYDIYLKGYVKETKTQITFSVDRHFTNIKE